MKRKIVMVSATLAMALLCLLVTKTSRSPADAPRFVPATSPPAGPFGSIHYDWDADAPFRDGKAWMFTVLTRSNHHEFLYDLRNQRPLGELLKGSAIFGNQDQTKVLCYGPDSGTASTKMRLFAFLDRASRGRIRLPTNYVETCWILDLRDNSARKLGQIWQRPGSGSRWHPAPGFRYGYTVPTTLNGGAEFMLADLEAGTMNQVKFAGSLAGWWDDHHILAENKNHNRLLFDVTTGKAATLLSANTLSARLRELDLTNTAADLGAFCDWNGHDFDFYLYGCDNRTYWNRYTNRTFLLKLEQPGPSIKLLYPDFQLRWLGHLDAAGTHYLYPGESGTPGNGGNGGVFLADLTNHTTQTLVSPYNGNQYALARFYGDGVIFFSNQVPYRINLDGSNCVPAFPLGP